MRPQVQILLAPPARRPPTDHGRGFLASTGVCPGRARRAERRGLSRKHVMESCEASLRRLRTDYVDIYRAHRFDERTPLEETLVAFDDLVRQGKVLYLGGSEWTAAQIESALTLADELGLRSRIVSNQPQCNMLWRVIEPEVLAAGPCAGHRSTGLPAAAQGVLTGKYRHGEALPEGSRAVAGGRGPRFIGRVLGGRLLEKVQELRPLAEGSGCRWLSRPSPGCCTRRVCRRRSSARAARSRSRRTRRPPASVWTTRS
ncbi:aldo/keto reductase [Streptomyces fulvoviolaceus]|nr:aldo/keto reductase [Streptomyces fulvoviolaceus]MCT9081270.1 aldo/keto reductase [Streptomyces fulvoviolaceus]